VEGKVWRNGCESGARSEAVAGREHAAAEAGRGSKFGQGSVAVSDSKKQVELVALKAAIEQMKQEDAFSERRACGLVMVAVSTYRCREVLTQLWTRMTACQLNVLKSAFDRTLPMLRLFETAAVESPVYFELPITRQNGPLPARH
jgi:hypothetical protein